MTMELDETEARLQVSLTDLLRGALEDEDVGVYVR